MNVLKGLLGLALVVCPCAFAQDIDPQGTPVDKHAFGVLPNYRTVEGSDPFRPISTSRKFKIAVGDTFGATSYLLGGVFAGLSQLSNSDPSFGQGLKGYLKRYGANTADQDIGNFMTEAILPTVLREDPRYFRKGTGSMGGRLGYAASRVFIAKSDRGNNVFNGAEFLGNGTVAAIGNIYHGDDRGLSPTMQRMFTQIGTDAISNVLKEIWPDVKRKYFSKNK